MMDISELKPCPFCGSDDTDDSYTLGTRANDLTKILHGAGCNNCGCQTEMFEDKALAIKAWNTRQPDNSVLDEAVMRVEALDHADFEDIDLVIMAIRGKKKQ